MIAVYVVVSEVLEVRKTLYVHVKMLYGVSHVFEYVTALSPLEECTFG